MKIHPDGTELIRVDWWMGRMWDRHDEANCLYSHICNMHNEGFRFRPKTLTLRG